MNEMTSFALMTSNEIATLTQKRHDNVLRDIKSMLRQVFDLEDNAALSYLGLQGVKVFLCEDTKRVAMISLNQELTMTLLTGYDVKARHKVITRWQALEQEHRSSLVGMSDLHALQRALHDETVRRVQLITDSRERVVEAYNERDRLARLLLKAMDTLTEAHKNEELVKADYDEFREALRLASFETLSIQQQSYQPTYQDPVSVPLVGDRKKIEEMLESSKERKTFNPFAPHLVKKG